MFYFHFFYSKTISKLDFIKNALGFVVEKKNVNTLKFHHFSLFALNHPHKYLI